MEIKDDYKILKVGSNYIKLEKDIKLSNYIENTNKCFVYGTYIDDFLALDKTYIYTLNVCATQELHRKIENQNNIINALTTRMEILENMISKFKVT